MFFIIFHSFWLQAVEKQRSLVLVRSCVTKTSLRQKNIRSIHRWLHRKMPNAHWFPAYSMSWWLGCLWFSICFALRPHISWFSPTGIECFHAAFAKSSSSDTGSPFWPWHETTRAGCKHHYESFIDIRVLSIRKTWVFYSSSKKHEQFQKHVDGDTINTICYIYREGRGRENMHLYTVVLQKHITY